MTLVRLRLVTSLVAALAAAGGCGTAATSMRAGSASRTRDGRPSPTTAHGDTGVSSYGYAAGEPERRKIVALAGAYYSAAIADDGARACSLMYSVFEEAIAEDYGGPPGSAVLRGRTCAVVMSKLFRSIPGQPVGVLASTKVTGVRVKGRQGLVLLGSSAIPTGELSVQLERSTWKVATLIGTACRACAAGTPPPPAPTREEIAAINGGPLSSTVATSIVSGPSNPPGRFRPGERDSTDRDDDPGSNDDAAILDFGGPAGAADRAAATALAERYYRAAVAGDGARVCGLLYSLVATSLPEEAEQPHLAGPRTCASVVAARLEQEHRRLAAAVRSFSVSDVRVNGERAYVFLRFGKAPERYTILHRDGGVWKVEQLFDVGLP